MIAKFEGRSFDDIKIWQGSYKNLHNIAHWHKETELIFIKSGVCKIGVNRKVYEGSKNDIFLIKSGDIHYINASPDSIITILIFEVEIANKILLKYSLKSPRLINNYSISDVMFEIEKEQKEKKPFYADRIYSIIYDLIIDIFRNEILCDTKSNNKLILLYQELIEYIDIHFSDITFSDAAEKAGYSKSHFSRVFFHLTGKTFTEYLNSVRIEKSVEMILNEEGTFTEIATKCGFNSIRHFNRTFKKETGFIPKAVSNNPEFNFLNIKPQKVSKKIFDPTLEVSQLLENKI